MIFRPFRCLMLAGFLLLGPALAPAHAAALDSEQKAEVEKIIADYLLRNPDLIVKVMEELDRRRKASEKTLAKRRLQENKAKIFQSRYDHVGNPGGRIPVVEFFDYQCGYCKRAFPAIKRLRSDRKDVRIIYKEFPILGPASVFAARAAIAARRQNKYLALHDGLIGHKGKLSEAVVMQIASRAGLDTKQLQADMARPEVQAIIDGNRALADVMNIRGTPAFIIGDALVPGAIPYSRMVSLVEKAKTNCSVC